MPELPDITIYLEALESRLVGATLERIRIAGPFVLRTFDPPVEATFGRKVTGLRRLGKRIAIGLDGELWLVIHLMIAGRLHWKERNAKVTGRIGLAAFDFTTGTLMFTEAGTKRRASLHVVAGETGLATQEPGGLDLFEIDEATFAEALTRDNRTLKRALTDPRRFSGIGNAYSDEILHRARLSPVTTTQRLKPDEIERLFDAVRATMQHWISLLREQTGDGFPEHVTAFRPEMAVHGRFGQPCPDCSTMVQRIRYADNETNYCPRCQTGGKVLADRSLSRLLKQDWPRSVEDWE